MSRVLDGARRCIDDEWRRGIGILAGADIVFRDGGPWSAGIEGGYWFAASEPARSAELAHFTFAGIVRVRL